MSNVYGKTKKRVFFKLHLYNSSEDKDTQLLEIEIYFKTRLKFTSIAVKKIINKYHGAYFLKYMINR